MVMRRLLGVARRKGGVPARKAAAQSRLTAREAIPCHVASLIGLLVKTLFGGALITAGCTGGAAARSPSLQQQAFCDSYRDRVEIDTTARAATRAGRRGDVGAAQGRGFPDADQS